MPRPGQSVPFAGAFVSATDSFLVAAYGFQNLSGICDPQGWTGEDRTNRVFANVSGSVLVNQPNIAGEFWPDGTTFPALRDTQALGDPRGIALTDSGTFVFADFSQSGQWRELWEMYPVEGIIRLYGTVHVDSAQYFPGHSTVVFDPSTGGIITLGLPIFGSASARILAFPAGGGQAVQLAGADAGSTADTVGSAALLGQASQIAVDASGNVYFSEIGSNRVRMLRRNDLRVLTIAGTGLQGFSGDGGPAINAQLSNPFGVSLNAAGTELLVIDQNNTTLRSLDLTTGLISTVPVNSPDPIAISSVLRSGSDVYVTDNRVRENFARLRRLTAGAWTTVAGGSPYGTTSSPLLGTEQYLMDPRGLIADGGGNIHFFSRQQRLYYTLQPGGDIDVLMGVPYAADMGTRALRVGTDMSTDADVVKNWVSAAGYGNGWSQRLTSSEFSSPDAVLAFDAFVNLEETQFLGAGFDTSHAGEFVHVQGLQSDGSWVFLNLRRKADVFGRAFALLSTDSHRGIGFWQYEVHLGTDGNDDLALPNPTQLRIVVQTSASGSAEDGLGTTSPAAALIDNITLTDGGGDVVPPVDFEDGTTGSWTLSAVNAAYGIGPFVGAGSAEFYYTHDTAPPATTVALRDNFDFNDPTCVWTFLSPGDTLANGVYASLTSPWIGMMPGDSTLLIEFSGKLNTIDQGRVLNVVVRGKNAGDDRPLGASPALFLRNSGTNGGDLAAPFINGSVLRYPDDFQFPAAYESLQVVFLVEDRGHALLGGLDGRPVTKHPFLDDIRFYQLGVDSDFDGVADAVDACPSECAAGQDSDGDGCVDPTATLRHVETYEPGPVRYRISANGVPSIADGSDFAALEQAFNVWTAVDGADVTVIREPDTSLANATPLDGINLITFEDPDYPFPGNVLGVTLTTSFTRRTEFGGRIVRPGVIVDTDMIFNPSVSFGTSTVPGTYDLTATATHEAGHHYGLGHSGVLDATMFFVLQAGLLASTLEDDDRAAIAAAYPAANLTTGFATVKGTVTRGNGGQPVPGALVTAVRLNAGVPADSTSSDYTAEDGSYALYRLPAGDYGVRITPLNGNVGGFPLVAGFVSDRLGAIAESNFQAEWWSVPESNSDPDDIGALTLAAGDLAEDIHVITNTDTVPPQILSVSPSPDTTGIRIDTAVLLVFSEPVADSTIGNAFRFRIDGNSGTLGGAGLLLEGGSKFIFTPSSNLQFGTTYEVFMDTSLTDREGVHLTAPFSSRFTTEVQPTIAITEILPSKAPINAYVTINGVGFTPNDPGIQTFVEFTQCGACAAFLVPAQSLTPTSLVTQVPFGTIDGPVRVIVDGGAGQEFSNALGFMLADNLSQQSPSLSGTPVSLGISPTDAALAPDAMTAFAAGTGGFVTINLDPGQPDLRVPIGRGLPGAKRIALTADGLRAFVTRPTPGDIIEVDVDPTSGTFGLARDSILVDGAPDGIVLSLSGKRAYVTDLAARQIYEIDIDRTSATRNGILRIIPTPAFTPTGGIALDPQRNVVYVTSVAGSREVDLDDPGSQNTSNSTLSRKGAAITPDSEEVLYAGGTNVSWFRRGDDGPDLTGTIALGGNVRDIVMSPQGQSAYVVNSTFAELAVIDILPGSTRYHQSVASTATGATPVAVDVSADGTTLAVANFGDATLSLYNLASGLGLDRVVRDVASPGDRIVVEQSASDNFSTGAIVEIGGTPVVSDYGPNGFALAIDVPNLAQQASSVLMDDTFGGRTLSLPFRIVTPISTFVPKATTVNSIDYSEGCGSQLFGRAGQMRLSPDGRLLGMIRRYDSCADQVSFFRTAADGQNVLGELVGDLFADAEVVDFSFTPTGQEIWFVGPDSTVRVVDADPSSPSFPQQTLSFGLPYPGLPSSVLRSPVGDRMYIAAQNGPSPLPPGLVTAFSNSGALRDTINLGPLLTAMGISPDGQFLIVAQGGHARVHDARSGAFIARTPTHGDVEFNYIKSIAATRNGNLAAGIFFDGFIAAWNLNDQSGSVGDELYFGRPWRAGLVPEELSPAPDGTGVIVRFADSDSIYKVGFSAFPPVVTPASAGKTVRSFALSSDGRQLWAGTNDAAGLNGEMFLASLSPATQLSLVSGPGQAAEPGFALPLPVRARLTGSQGRPQAGVAVAFQLGGSGHGTMDNLSGRTLVHRLTDSNGEASVQWIMPALPGSYGMTIRAEGVAGGTAMITGQSSADDSQIDPIVTVFGPANGTSGLNAGSAVSATFNQKMDSVSVASKLTLFANGSPVSGSLRFQNQGRYALFQPAQPMPFAASCSLVVRAGAMDQEGQVTAANAFTTFTVQSQPQLFIQSVSPPAATKLTSIVLNGQGFSAVKAQNTVLVNGVPASVTAATATSLTATVPQAASTGNVTVTVGGTTSNGVHLIVLAPNTDPGGLVGDLPGAQGIRDVAVTSDGLRAYVTNPATNTVSALDIQTLANLTDITVGTQPQAIAILPDGSKAYVGNTGSDDVSVIDVNPASSTYHSVLTTIPVGDMPVDVAVSAFGNRVIVVNAGENPSLTIIDAEPGSATQDQAVTTIGLGSSSTSIAISADGGTAYVGGETGVIVLDLLTGAVVTTIGTGSSVNSISITADATIVLALTDSDSIYVIDTSEGPNQNQVVTTIGTGSSSTSIAISADGALAFVTNADGDVMLVYEIETGTGGSNAGTLPSPPVRLILQQSVQVGQSPVASAPAVDATGRPFVLVANEGSGTVSVIGFPTALGTIQLTFDFNPNTLNMKSKGRWVKAVIELQPPWTADLIDVSSLRLNGALAVDPGGPVSLDDEDTDGNLELSVKFSRQAVQLLLAEGDAVPVNIIGVADSKSFSADDTIRVIRPGVMAPTANQILVPNQPFTLIWEVPSNVNAPTVAVMHSFDRGLTWELDVTDVPNDGQFAWTSPDTLADSVKVAILLVESQTAPDEYSGVMAVSSYFHVLATNDARLLPAVLTFAPIQPNPAHGRAEFRFGLPSQARVKLELFDVQGRRLKTLVDGVREAGWHRLQWSGDNTSGARVGPGLFFVRFEAGGIEFRRRLVWLR